MSSSVSANSAALKRAAIAIKNAKALIITAGAGMGVDSGLPDFRGPEGFWRAYPMLKDKNIKLSEMSNPQWFQQDPEFAWGFFGHRYNLYKKTQPHEGFQILKKWAMGMPKGHFVFTSNVDGHFQKAGFDEVNVVECHGSINFMQCCDLSVTEEIWPTQEDDIKETCTETLRMKGTLPTGPPGSSSKHLARPNILMFGDWSFAYQRTAEQNEKYERFKSEVAQKDKFVVVEIGAGKAVPTVRYQSEDLVEHANNLGTLVRINPLEPEAYCKDLCIPLPMKGLEALIAIDNFLKQDY